MSRWQPRSWNLSRSKVLSQSAVVSRGHDTCEAEVFFQPSPFSAKPTFAASARTNRDRILPAWKKPSDYRSFDSVSEAKKWSIRACGRMLRSLNR